VSPEFCPVALVIGVCGYVGVARAKRIVLVVVYVTSDEIAFVIVLIAVISVFDHAVEIVGFVYIAVGFCAIPVFVVGERFVVAAVRVLA
jgi:hypothetical protein